MEKLIPRISETVYVHMCRIVGTPELVSIRREVVDIAEIILKPVEERKKLRRTLSGSRREGFIPPLASDVDLMFWPSDLHVTWDINQVSKHNTGRCSLMEFSVNSPGFAMLRLLTPINDFYIKRSCVRINDGLYISSAKYRENTLSLFIKNSIQHGLCASGRRFNIKYDFALCFACKLWPFIATSFTLRCHFQSWPPSHVLRDIINSGCHVVPVGLKGSAQEDCEWRISFSLAEQKLVCCMNHTQFMCYGLLKLFLKEVLSVDDTNEHPLLCSYFMKTVLFWVIQKNTVIDWNPSSLLSGFWLCFKFLLSCVYHGHLPNFFIPENNLFICKVFGHSRQLLYERLFKMYRLGISCLLHCRSLRDYLTLVICERKYLSRTAKLDIIHVKTIEWELFSRIDWLDNFDSFCSNIGYCFATLYSAFRRLQARNISPWQHVAIRKFISSILRLTVFHLYNTSINVHNKVKLRTMYAGMNMLRVSAEMGCISDKINQSLILYTVGKNKDAITNLTMIKRILTQPYVMYHGFIDQQRYSCKVVGRTLAEKMRTVVMNIKLYLGVSKELELELKMTTNAFIHVPPYVLTLMLLVLCYRDNPHKQQEALNELYIVLHYDERHHIGEYFRDISWQILGICQQICGDHQGALLSYQNSLKQIPVHNIQEATYRRIRDVQYRNMYECNFKNKD